MGDTVSLPFWHLARTGEGAAPAAQCPRGALCDADSGFFCFLSWWLGAEIVFSNCEYRSHAFEDILSVIHPRRHSVFTQTVLSSRSTPSFPHQPKLGTMCTSFSRFAYSQNRV
jgi:hypothetical protein